MKLVQSTTCCFTGHRPKGLPWGYNENLPNCIKFKKELKVLLENAINYGLDRFLTGMAEGFDMIACETIIELKKRYNNLKLIAVIPCLGQELKWKTSQQKRYHTLLNNCDDKIVLSNTYTPTCMNERNKYMIEHSSVVIACYNGQPSGTKNTIDLAKGANCKVKIIYTAQYTQ